MKIFLFLLFGIGGTGGIGLTLTLLYFSPEEFPILAPILFYISLFLFSFSVFSLLGYATRRILTAKINRYISFNLSFRQGVFLGGFVCYLAFLLSIRSLTWWAIFLALLIILLLEMFFMFQEDKK
jgi:hypothetical protein